MERKGTPLPHQTDELFLCDGGIETSLIFLDGFELPYFAAFHLLNDEKGCKGLQHYYRRYLQIASELKLPFILESPTWRANADWITALEYPPSAIRDINKKAVQLMVDLKKEYREQLPAILISGCVGPRGDGYRPENKMSIDHAEAYHLQQIQVFKATPVDMVTAITMNYAEEAIGIARAANKVQLPVVISFTVETDGKLPAGMTLKTAIELVDQLAATPPAYYMINCAHPSHFFHELLKGRGEPWTKRIRGIRANASCKSHAELDEAPELDRGKPEELGKEYTQLKNLLPHLNVFGGCCGTDEEHVRAIARQIIAATLAV